MKQLIFSKDDFELIKSCVQNEIDALRVGLYPQDMETTNRIEKRIDDCKKLLERLKNAEDK